MKIFYVISTKNEREFEENSNNLNYIDYIIKKNSHNDKYTLLNKLLKYGVFDIQTYKFQEMNKHLFYEIELFFNDTENNKTFTNI